jgi:hypothetical protein
VCLRSPHYKQYRHTGCAHFNLLTVFVNAEMLDCPASSQSGTRNEKNPDAGTSQVPE